MDAVFEELSALSMLAQLSKTGAIQRHSPVIVVKLTPLAKSGDDMGVAQAAGLKGIDRVMQEAVLSLARQATKAMANAAAAGGKLGSSRRGRQ